MLQIFAICALYTTANFELDVTADCTKAANVTKTVHLDYPFRFGEQICPKRADTSDLFVISVDVSSDAKFFVATGVLSILYCIFIVAVYTMIDDIYKSKSEIPLAVSIVEIAELETVTDVEFYRLNRTLC